MKLFRWLLLSVALCSAVAWGVIETYEFSSPALEARYKALSQELRCPKCQNQNIADSNAPISRDLRAIVHEKLETGATDSEIIDFLVDRYGEFVRYRPGLDRNTLWLWSAPLILLLMAMAVVLLQIRRDRASAMSPVQEARAEALRQKFQDEGSQ
ncbi:cytochrome c-type biogenesis protein CcmH [Luminiphilus sp.]|jgi:cytochrome c-type biogenesis protein CcmH|nr:cytochrome c-type biogenesis protein CcmH [Luminiphilus sp.]MDA8815126.1 cytochrome c-type biogenesis protein CcmH [Luminiphilus sp.]MDA9836172.1 cytochrome c-type biogenesis protein CcmH [Luminiphilus sp.]MDB2379739.1 cytochrome c-type biogenesis protein CcmH [Luminiphilus sp.]MDB2668037.1 cytochrome c-type biogenesis protein CcmH [Luminiphilus sp.]